MHFVFTIFDKCDKIFVNYLVHMGINSQLNTSDYVVDKGGGCVGWSWTRKTRKKIRGLNVN
jgi:hypothetical protein